MSKKDEFIEVVEKLFNGEEVEITENAKEYLKMLCAGNGVANKPKFTENGKRVLEFMQQNKESYNNMFKAKEIGEGLFISSRGASGALRKLVTDGYAEKIGEDPVVYTLTSLGETTDVNAE